MDSMITKRRVLLFGVLCCTLIFIATNHSIRKVFPSLFGCRNFHINVSRI